MVDKRAKWPQNCPLQASKGQKCPRKASKMAKTGGPEGVLGVSWALLGLLGAFLGLLGAFLGPLGAILGSACKHLGRPKSEIMEVGKPYNNNRFS